MTDGYLFADTSTDPLLLMHKNELANVKRKLFERFEVKILFQKNESGMILNKKVSTIIAEMRKSGQLDALLSTVNQPFEPWQLSELPHGS